jgi:hypothetical protein
MLQYIAKGSSITSSSRIQKVPSYVTCPFLKDYQVERRAFNIGLVLAMAFFISMFHFKI